MKWIQINENRKGIAPAIHLTISLSSETSTAPCVLSPIYTFPAAFLAMGHIPWDINGVDPFARTRLIPNCLEY
jgi:hypothetical protein